MYRVLLITHVLIIAVLSGCAPETSESESESVSVVESESMPKPKPEPRIVSDNADSKSNLDTTIASKDISIADSNLVNQENIGKQITVEGKCGHTKGGAILVVEGLRVYIDGIISWSSTIGSDSRGKKVIVTGILSEDYSLPVFVQDENDPIEKQGIPVPKGTDLKKASHRFILLITKWELIE